MRPETILFVIGIRVSNSKCIYYFDMAKDKFLARNCCGSNDGRGVAEGGGGCGGLTARLSQLKLQAATKSLARKLKQISNAQNSFRCLSPLFQF